MVDISAKSAVSGYHLLNLLKVQVQSIVATRLFLCALLFTQKSGMEYKVGVHEDKNENRSDWRCKRCKKLRFCQKHEIILETPPSR